MTELEAVLNYERYLKTERGFSNYTVLNYMNDIAEYRKFLLDNKFGDVFDISQNVARYYLSFMNKELNFKASSVSRKLSSLRGFYKFLMAENARGDLPFQSAAAFSSNWIEIRNIYFIQCLICSFPLF